MMTTVTIIKRDEKGRETWRYTGEVLQQSNNHITLEAYFDRDDRMLDEMPLCRGDRFVETYFFDRWYNIFEIHSREDDSLRGWYCNIGKPAKLEGISASGGPVISYIDLALDLLVFPDGKQVVLDEEEFVNLTILPQERDTALAALSDLKARFGS
jgi:protein associated with RNAse G/E